MPQPCPPAATLSCDSPAPTQFQDPRISLYVIGQYFSWSPTPRQSATLSDIYMARTPVVIQYVRMNLSAEPWYLPLADEVGIFEAAYRSRLPVLLKGPTGCGKTRFIEYMTWRLYRHDDSARRALPVPLVTVACHEDLSATDLVGRYLLAGNETVWMDGPLTRAVRSGAICYLDEVVEARKDTTVVVHSLTDHRRVLPIEKRGGGREILDVVEVVFELGDGVFDGIAVLVIDLGPTGDTGLHAMSLFIKWNAFFEL